MNSRLRLLLAGLVLPLLCHAAPTGSLSFEEVFGLVRSHLTDVPEAELNKAAALGLLQQLGSKVQLVTTNAPAEAGPSNGVSRAALYGRNFAYLRVEAATATLADDLERAWQNLSQSNRLRGAILDLRYAKGQNYRAAAQAADLFVLNDQALIEAGDEKFRSGKTGPQIKAPVAVLVNRQTSGAPEALAAALREAGAALLIGSPTAGEARLFETFGLSGGQKLRIGTLPVLVNGKAIPPTGVAPDIFVEVSPLDERAYYQDPFTAIPRGFGQAGGTNEAALATTRRRFNEAELVRRHREGIDLSAAMPDDAPDEPGRQTIQDPALARAVDFLKGLAALRPAGAE